MELAIISDSHVPTRAEAIPEPFRERIAAADHVIHAGDFETADALATVRDLATDLTCCERKPTPSGVGVSDNIVQQSTTTLGS